MKETQIQNKILAYLHKHGVFAFRVNNIPVYDSKIHAYRSAVTIKGIPDIIGIMPDGTGRILGIEVKLEKGKQSPEQMMFQKRCESEGGVYILARSVDDCAGIFSL